MRRLLPLVLILSLTAHPFAAPQLSVHLLPFSFISQPRPTIRIIVHIARHTDNRLAQLELVGDDYYSESEWNLEGELAAMSYEVERKSLPAGHYQATLTVYRVNNKMLRARSEEAEVLN